MRQLLGSTNYLFQVLMGNLYKYILRALRVKIESRQLYLACLIDIRVYFYTEQTLFWYDDGTTARKP